MCLSCTEIRDGVLLLDSLKNILRSKDYITVYTWDFELKELEGKTVVKLTKDESTEKTIDVPKEILDEVKSKLRKYMIKGVMDPERDIPGLLHNVVLHGEDPVAILQILVDEVKIEAMSDEAPTSSSTPAEVATSRVEASSQPTTTTSANKVTGKIQVINFKLTGGKDRTNFAKTYVRTYIK